MNIKPVIDTCFHVPVIVLGLLYSSVPTFAQLETPGPVEFIGAQPSERQIEGLAVPIAPDAAVSVEAARTTSANFAVVSGTTVLTGYLVPVPADYVTGMTITIMPTATSEQGAVLDLNGLGIVQIIKANGLQLDSADLRPGVPARLIFNGQEFLMLSSSTIPCKSGFSPGAREFCIEDSSRTVQTFFEAMTYCKDKGARLCKNSEWVYTCLKNPGFIGTVLNYEWVDDAANNSNGAKKVGNGGNGESGTVPGIDCKHGFWADPLTVSRFRCCMTR